MAGRNYKNTITKIKALGHAKKKSSNEIKNNIKNYLAKCQAIHDINKDIELQKLNPHEKQFKNVINNKTFDFDFNELDNPYAVDYNENKNFNMKNNIIRLTENDLHNIIKESVYQVLNERIKSEKGMTDDEVRNRRLRNFMLDNDDEHEDSIYDDKQESHKDKMNKKRIKQHYIKHPKHHNINKDDDTLN